MGFLHTLIYKQPRTLSSFLFSNRTASLETKMGAFRFHQYQVVGRALPTEKDVQPKIYRMKLWATNEVRAKSKFWYFLRKLKKVKKSNGQMLAINEIFEKNPTTIKNFGIWLRYQSRTGYHNMYKEYRDTTLNGAVEQMYTEMASRHRVRFPCIQIIKTATVPAKLCKRESTKQFHNSKIKFPLVFRKIFEKNPTTIKNFGIWLRYQSRTGYHNMYKEYRDTTLNGAVEQMYTEMASRHRVRFPCIQIIKTATVPAKLCKRESTKQFHNSKIKFPLVFRKVRPPTRKLKTTYKASKPNLFM
ncbi:hypothetical protein HID58_090401 [Brassica napus]|uniref:Large ribosomal subunit protein eL20 domain-containing protein n=1 Tax=Brassica napus TaxID=3708 RepID=A0ABQ7X071_BRANA|nr:hypothetical protein HID58_090401 [Brassica napus]